MNISWLWGHEDINNALDSWTETVFGLSGEVYSDRQGKLKQNHVVFLAMSR